MRKTTLDLTQLSVETFETAPAPEPRGTVHANGLTQFTSYCQCQYATDYGTCQGTCVNTCGGPTCDAPCRSTQTFYMTCQTGCGWTDGQAVCLEPQTRDC